MSDVPAIIASGLPGNREDAQRAGITIAARMSAADFTEVRKWTIVLVLSFLFFAAFTTLNAVYGHKFYDITGRAKWIWPRVEMSSEIPVAFFAARDLDLPPTRYYTHIKIACDPEYTLYLNGREIASKRMTDASALDVYDVSSLVHDGRNRIVIAVRSVKGVGGLLVAVDLAPETENWVVTDRTWKLSRVWDASLLQRDPGVTESPIEIGQPPLGRWNYLEPRDTPIESASVATTQPQTSFEAKTRLPEIKVVGGTAIGSTRPVRVFGYDFGWLDGRVRIVRDRDINLCQVLEVRYANAKEELMAVEGKTESIVFAPGESAVADPDVRHFRWIGVYGRPARADVIINR